MSIKVKIAKHNQALRNMMEDEGYEFVYNNSKNTECFYTPDGHYEPFPVAYITGPSRCEQGVYMSVQGPDGWRQRTMPERQVDDLREWAFEEGKKLLKEYEPAG